MLSAFYGALAGTCFGLLGLWWAVVQFRQGKDNWLEAPGRKQTTYYVSQYFLIPGLMSMFSLLSEELTVLWRFGFGMAALLGIYEGVRMYFGNGAGIHGSAMVRNVTLASLVVYLLIGVLAVNPTMFQAFIPELRGIIVEGILATTLVFLGVQFAWFTFTDI